MANASRSVAFCRSRQDNILLKPPTSETDIGFCAVGVSGSLVLSKPERRLLGISPPIGAEYSHCEVERRQQVLLSIIAVRTAPTSSHRVWICCCNTCFSFLSKLSETSAII